MRKIQISALFWLVYCISAPVPVLAVNVAVPHTIFVVGDAQQSFAPDLARMTISVQTLGKSVADATGENARKSTAVIRAIVAQGVSKGQISTNYLTIKPKYAPVKGGSEYDDFRPIAGYEADNSVHVLLTDPGKATAVFKAALSAGVNDISGIDFLLKKPEASKDQVYAAAVHNAMQRAEAMAKAVHMRLGAVQSLTDPIAATMMNTNEGPGAAQLSRQYQEITILSGQVVLDARVILRIELKAP